MTLDVETYGYPKIFFLGKKGDKRWVRVTEGWFFPDVHPDEPATYIDYYIDEEGNIELILDNGNIFFDFWTPLDDYLLPWCRTMTIGDLYKDQKETAKQ